MHSKFETHKDTANVQERNKSLGSILNLSKIYM